MNKKKLHILAWGSTILLYGIFLIMLIDVVKKSQGDTGLYASIFLIFCCQLLGAYLFFALFNLKHEGWKRLSIVSAILGGLFSFLIFEEEFSQRDYHIEMFLSIFLGIYVISLFIHVINWIYKGFYKNK